MFSLTLNNATSEDLLSLSQWLEDDPDIQRTTTIDLSGAQESKPGAMGAVFDVISLAITSGFSAANLAVAFASWKSSRDVKSSLIINQGGRQVIISGSDPGDIAAITQYFSNPEEKSH